MAKKGKVQTFDVCGLKYTTPAIPPLNEIRGFDLPRKKQVWHRRLEWEQWDWNIDPKAGDVWFLNPGEGQLEWYEQEIERINTGDWIMINGEPVWFNKYCYFFHQWALLLEGMYGTYRDTSLDFFRFYELVESEPFTLGMILIKGRRLGASSMSASIQALHALTENNHLQGIVSKTGIDAKEMYLMVKNCIENLPPFLKPDMNNVGETEIHLAQPAQRISKNNKIASGNKGLNTRVNWLNTAENSYDGRALRSVIIDEAAKWDKVDVSVMFSKVKETLVKGARVVGKVIMITTVNAGDKGGDNFRTLWDQSDFSPEKLNELGWTKSRMKRFFIPGFRGVDGYVGAFGESVVDTPTKEQTEYLKSTGASPNPYIGAREYREIVRKSLANNPEELAEECRKYPFEWQEVFKNANNLCHFNTEDLQNQLERIQAELEKLGRDINKGENGRRGWFVKGNDEKIIWKDDPNGLWYVLKFLPSGMDNKFMYKHGIKCPNNTGWGGAGLDTFSNAQQTVEKGSDACCIIRERYNSLNPENSGMPVAMYLGRPKTKREFHDQIFNGLQYYGVRILAERSPTDWEDYAIDNDLASPLDHKKKYGYLVTTKRADNSEVYGIAPQDKQAREEHLTEMVEDGLLNTHKVWFRRIIKDRFKFNIDERTLYDASMADGYSLMALKENQQIVTPTVHTEQIIRTYKLT